MASEVAEMRAQKGGRGVEEEWPRDYHRTARGKCLVFFSSIVFPFFHFFWADVTSTRGSCGCEGRIPPGDAHARERENGLCRMQRRRNGGYRAAAAETGSLLLALPEGNVVWS